MRFLFAVFTSLALGAGTIPPASADKIHAIAMHGSPALPPGFHHFPYADPEARKGGQATYGVIGTYNGFNPFSGIDVNSIARGLFNDSDFGNMVYETMMTRARNEPFTLYGLLAESVELDDERTGITFHLNPKARFSDGVPVTPEDVLFTYRILKEKGRYPFSTYMKRIASAEKVGTNGVRVRFTSAADREFALILAGSIPVLPRHAVKPEWFERSSFDIIPGSGAYTLDSFNAGNHIVYRRNPDYWGADLPVNRGISNFDTVKILYFRNDNARFEAFKKGMIDVFIEDNPTRWRIGYDFPAMRQGQIKKTVFHKQTPAAVKGFVFNTRRPIFADIKVREALSEVFDFEWVNRNLYGNAYSRLTGFWDGSALSSVGRPANARERALLAPFPDTVSADVMEGRYHPPKTDGSGFNRKQLETAWDKLQKAGLSRKDGKIYMRDGQLLRFEIMTRNPEEEKIALSYQHSLARLGIDITVRTVDDSQYQTRLGSYDYDMIIGRLQASSLSPGAEQYGRWSSAARDEKNTLNYAGAANPAVDAMIAALLNTRSREDFESAVRALDRVLISQHYYLPLYYLPEQWVASWAPVRHPQQTPLNGFLLPAWWRETP
ncbi:MAG: Hypothetical protein BHV28_06780 [Candidatus Tokpelaia hoelldobleri]|uniref:Solute-binding protein family 5 domain-containing protein n=1 Tax=Candidatus Tokpelaia hoelldobleri TaxID=1902579 RepID=A0A1U9JU36_9HYPH|nr:MAG: Hypothetical protein BHV28_06780 [Candidatus Tokpelaia hoelldoblerii]